MFESVRAICQEPKKLSLATRKGTEIDNRVDAGEVSPGKALGFDKMRDKYEWKERKPPIGIYNCAGLVWASRRTGIWEAEEYERILEEDGYRKLPNLRDVVVGDIAVYRCKKDRLIVHLARVCNVLQGSVPAIVMPVVISKFPGSGEYIHNFNIGPFTDFTCDFFTDRENIGEQYHAPSTPKLII